MSTPAAVSVGAVPPAHLTPDHHVTVALPPLVSSRMKLDTLPAGATLLDQQRGRPRDGAREHAGERTVDGGDSDRRILLDQPGVELLLGGEDVVAVQEREVAIGTGGVELRLGSQSEVRPCRGCVAQVGQVVRLGQEVAADARHHVLHELP